MNNNELIGEVQKIREKNNKLWMQILKLAVKHAPEETKEYLRKITSNDIKVSEYIKELADGPEIQES